jgi:peptide/nickel transport system substrate-binding protein
LSAALLVTLTATVAACGGDSGSGSHSSTAGSGGTPVAGGKLTYAMDQEPDCLNPHVSGLDAVAVIDRNVVDSLVAQAPDGKIVPWLASSWTASKDLRTYTFTLRKGVTFQDGSPFDAAAVKANLDNIAAPATKSHYAVTLLGPYAGTTVVNPSTVQVRFKQPFAPFLQAASTTYLGMLSPKSLSRSEDSLCHTVVGSGAFSFVKWSPHASIVLDRNPAYRWAPAFSANQKPAYLSQVTYRFLPDDAVRVGSLTSHQADIVQNVPPISAKSVKANSSLQLLTKTAPGGAYTLFLKTVGGPLADERLRIALQRSLDVDTIVSAASAGQFTRAWSEIGPTTAGYDRTTEGSWPYDAALANKQLDAAGWTARDSGGYRTKDGKRLVLDWLQISQGSQQSQANATLAQLIQAAAKAVGIQIELDPVPVGTYLKRAYDTHDYDLFSSSYGGEDPDELRLAFASATRPQNGTPNGNVSLIADPQLDGWLNAGAATLDTAARASDYAKVQTYVNQHAVAIPLYAPTDIDAATTKVHGLTWDIGAFPLLQAAWLAQ